MQKYVVLHKKTGETPLACMEAWRATQSPALANVPLTYAGRLDPLASGKLLVLIGEECKQKEQYLNLDKAYDFFILFGLTSDSGDTLGLITAQQNTCVKTSTITSAMQECVGSITLPYPAFSSKPVAGKPLHTWAVEGRLSEITIPTTTTTVYTLTCRSTETLSREMVYAHAEQQIESIPPVTELRKALGNDFRRPAIRTRWQEWYQATAPETTFTLAHCRVICSSGTYVRSIAACIGELCDSGALAFSIERTHLGRYHTLGPINYWWPRY